MCESCGLPSADVNGYYPGEMSYNRYYRENPLDWQDLYLAQAFESKDEKERFDVSDVQIDPRTGDVDFESKRRLSKRQQMEVGQDIFNQFVDQQSPERTPKKKAKRKSNNDNSPEQVFPSGVIKVNKNDPFDQGQLNPGSLVPALRNQMPTFNTMKQQDFLPVPMQQMRMLNDINGQPF